MQQNEISFISLVIACACTRHYGHVDGAQSVSQWDKSRVTFAVD